jgi:hypothetical protein
MARILSKLLTRISRVNFEIEVLINIFYVRELKYSLNPMNE